MKQGCVSIASGFRAIFARALLFPLLLAHAALAAQYIVQKGDTLEEIAKKKGVSVEALASRNAIRDRNDIRAGQILQLPAAGGAAASGTSGRRYTVREGDTLGDIASRNGVSALDLARANRLEDPDELKKGQILVIPLQASGPAASVVAAVARRFPLPASLKASLDRLRVVQGKWRYVVVHHSGSTRGTVAGMDAYHRYRRGMENGLAYHFVIGNGYGMGDGEIAICNRWRGQLNGGHLASESLNAKSIGICLVGNFETGRPSTKQLQSLYALVAYLRDRCRLPTSSVKLHRQINTRPTECPGSNFPGRSLQQNL